ncbi:hypothetical protein C5167_018224 [Papaver somniferum]|uniref:Dolichyl-diphosphooligosaccharide-protein glycosyltransferase subunit OST5 n=1 Tax=Papaver somniferum TaxID=3469 RepID=A0A4Y7IQP4_PAPSO|nr:hypothetical protein C5167_018224 [Papaver somniferum]
MPLLHLGSSPKITASDKSDLSSSTHQRLSQAGSVKSISSPIPVTLFPTLAALMLTIGLIVTASFFIYEATSSRKTRSVSKELITGTVASVFLGFGSLFLLLASGVYV